MTEQNENKVNPRHIGPLVVFIGLTAVGGALRDPQWLRITLLVVAVVGMALFSGLLLRDWKKAQKN